MKIQEKKAELKEVIHKTLTPLIKSDYVLWDLPYHKNIGDLLIWKGELDFLSSLPYKCLHYASIATYDAPKISTNTTILFHGGGNFGDLWRGYHNFKQKIIENYPNNHIIIFPQSVFYKDITLLEKDSEIWNRHKKLTICVRDTVSYELLKKYYTGNLLLLPDMAFCINTNGLNLPQCHQSERTLFLQRKDREEVNYNLSFLKDKNITTKDWPTFEKGSYVHKIMTLIQLFPHNNFLNKFINQYAIKIHLPYCIKLGIKFISSYNYIYTSRLHVGILSILLNKPFTYLDNSYGKNSSFYNTWLKDVEDIKLIGCSVDCS